jgi:hypothetical protein
MQFSISYGASADSDGLPNDVRLTRESTFTLHPVAFDNRQVTSPISAGGVATLTGTIDEPNPGENFFLTVDWGDGSAAQTFTFPPGTPPDVSLQHQYLQSGAFTISMSWQGDQSTGSSATLPLVVQPLPPTVSAGANVTLRKSPVLDRVVSFSDPGQDSVTATVDYGDGSRAQPLAVGPNHQFRLHHRYRRRGKFDVTVRVRDSAGGVSMSSFLVVVKRPH